MKPSPIPALLAAVAILLPCGARSEPASGGRFTLDAWVVPSGGGSAAGGRFRVDATVGPGAAGRTAAAPRFGLVAGFWSPVTVIQTPDAPELRIELLGDGRVRLSWDALTKGWRLEGSEDPTSGVWQPVATEAEPTDTGSAVTVSASGTVRCYRLGR